MGRARLHGPGLNTAVSATAADYAARLLLSLGAVPSRPIEVSAEHPALSWARSGMMSITGTAAGEPQMCPLPLAACADGALAALAALQAHNPLADVRGSQLLAERAALSGLMRNGSISPGGACRLLPTADGGIAVNLTRVDDWALLPAWLEVDGVNDWTTLADAVAARPSAALIERARLLGLAVAPDRFDPSPVPWYTVMDAGAPVGAPSPRRRTRAVRVVDLSSLWAGPLCGHLLRLCGAEVIKVESWQRPDGARLGQAEFYDQLNAGKRSVMLDLDGDEGREQLRALLLQADIVIESARPRGLRQLGINASDIVAQQPQLTWISITGYGRQPPQDNWIAFGDDAGVAAGLSQLMFQATGERLFVGDAIADPLTGIHAALAAWASYRSGGGRLISIALCDVVRHCIGVDRPADAAALRARMRQWTQILQDEVPAQPQARAAAGTAPAAGADTDAVLAALRVTC